MSKAARSRRVIVLDPADNVATALVPLVPGQTVADVTLVADIPRGHKFALRRIAAGRPVVKYGQPIGRATKPIAPGEHVHVHNLMSARAGSGATRT